MTRMTSVYMLFAQSDYYIKKAQLRYAVQEDDKAAMYIRWAADVLKKQ